MAWTLCASADALIRRNGVGEREKAMSPLDEPLAMRPLTERLLSRRVF